MSTYMTDKERSDLRTILQSIDAQSTAEKMISLGIMIGTRISGLSQIAVEAPKGV